MDSRIVLDQKGGELLLGHGDMLVLSPRSSKLTRAQGTLVDDKEIRNVVRFMREVAGPSFERQLMQIRPEGSDEARVADSANNSSASLAAAQEDPMFSRAVEIVLETRRGSVSLLQRRLAIGYTRSSRLIDLMGIAGIISDHKGSVARDVLITPEEWEAMKRMAAEHGVVLGDAQGELFKADPIVPATDAAPHAEAAEAAVEVPDIRVVPADGPGTETYVEEAPFAEDSSDDEDDWEGRKRDRARREKARAMDDDDDL
jgi:S-DNA-T family DNA segregation ATPase FtsK/SpoIIIE